MLVVRESPANVRVPNSPEGLRSRNTQPDTDRSTNKNRRSWLGGAGVPLIVIVLLLPTFAAGAHPSGMIRAPFPGSTSTPSGYSGYAGCSKAYGVPLKWNDVHGFIRGKNRVNATSCGGSPSGLATYDSAFALDSTTVVVPFKVHHGGNNSIMETWNVKLRAFQATPGSGCPNKTVNYHPTINTTSEGFCDSYSSLSFTILESLVDLTNGSFTTFNYSSFANDSSRQWENDTLCSHFRKVISCTNSTFWSNSSYEYGQNEWVSGFTYTGKSVLHMWTNASGMLAAHTYGLVVTVQIDSDVELSSARLVSGWNASASASILMGIPGNGARLESIALT
jgi:hypothetical protein